MSPKEADKVIKAGKPITVYNVLEVYVVDKWRGAGYVVARKPRKLTMADLKKVAKSVRINTGGDITVIGLELEE